MTRTTLALDDDLLRSLKERAAREGRTLQSLTNDLIRQSLRRAPRKGYSLRLKGWDAAEQPGVDICDRDRLHDLMNGR